MKSSLAFVLLFASFATGCGTKADKSSALNSVMASEPIRVLASVQVQDGTEEIFRAGLPAMIEATRAETGNIRYYLHESLTKPTTYTFFEEWQDQAAIDAHLASAHTAAFLGQVGSILLGPPQLETYKLASSPEPDSKLAKAAAKDGLLYAIVHVSLKQGGAKTYLEASSVQVPAMRREPGLELVEFLQSTTNPDEFAVYSVWKDAEALNAHKEAAHTQKFLAKIADVLSAPPALVAYRLLP